ncbi:MAG: sensor histidine kinase [Thermodesulfobacteriota bacterium]
MININKEHNDIINEYIKVLMVEDNSNYGQLVQTNLQSLKSEKFKVILANSLKNGLQELAINDIDIVLLDLNLPDSYGIDTFLKIKKNSPNMPIIILSSLDDEETATESIQMGAQDYIVKDIVNIDLLVKSINYSIERQKTSKELEKQKIDVEKAYSQLRSQSVQLIHSEKMNTVGKMVAGISHGLNNPLMAVINTIQYLIEKTSEHDENLEVLKMAEESSQRCIDIVNNLQSFAHMEMEDSGFEAESLITIIDQVLYLLGYQIQKTNIKLIRNVPNNIPLLWMKINHMQQVFLNIINNSIDSLEKSEKKEIVIEVISDGELVNVKIKDSGEGISPIHLQEIFDPFFTTKPIGKCAGLGLSISKNIIEDHLGKISCESEVGVGTTIKFSLPLEKRKKIKRSKD